MTGIRLPALALLAISVVAAIVLDVVIVPPAEIPVAIFYAVPLLLFSHLFSPRATLILGAVLVAAYMLTTALREIPFEVSLPRATSLVLVGLISYLLARSVQDARDARRIAERERDRAQAAHSELQAFLAMVAHDLAGPLTAILGRVGLATRSSGLPDGVRSELEMTVEQVRRMERLVRDLLDAGRMGSGAFEVHARPVDLATLVRDVVRSQDLVSDRHRLEVDAPERLVAQVDPDRMAQAVGNLIANAIRYSPAGGPVRVCVSQEEQRVLLSVFDEGVGLAAEEVEGIFALFSRGSAHKQVPGTGLGLYITSGIVRAHGGRIWAESEGRGRGSTFRISLPI